MRISRGSAPRAGALLFVAGAALVAGCNRSGGDLPQPGSDPYRETVSAFTIGTVALETVNLNLIDPNLKRASELAPGEPAIWANLAIRALRTSRLDDAVAHFEKAKKLGGDDDRLLLIEGLLAEKRGRFADALAAYRRAAEKNPRNLKALYLVAQTAERLDAPDKAATVADVLDRILAVSPGNQLALTDRMKTAAETGDRERIARTLEILAPRAAAFPPEARRRYDALRKDTATAAPLVLKRTITQFQNMLNATGDFQASRREITFEGANIGLPLSRFLKLANPPASPAAPDTALAYTVAPADVDGGDVAVYALDEKTPPLLLGMAGAALRAGKASVAAPNQPVAVAAFDLDDEVGHIVQDETRAFRLELAAAGKGGLRLFRAAGSALADVTAAAKLPAAVAGRAYAGVWSVDIEADGDLDLVLAPAAGDPLVLQNNGDRTLTPIPSPFPKVAGPVRAFAWADVDADGDPDAFLIDATGKVRVFANERSGLFRERAAPAGLDQAVALAVLEATGDFALDVAVLREDGAVLALSDTGDGRTWADPKPLAKSAVAGARRLIAADLDNNGAVDLAVAGAQATEVLLADQKLAFTAAPVACALSARAAADTDGDGLLDLVGIAGGKPAVAKAASSKKYAWQTFTLRAKKPNSPTVKINAFAVGGEVEVRAGLLYQKRPIDGPQVHVGLGETSRIDIARVVWPTGDAQSEGGADLKTGPMVADQRLGGSCPFLFTWDGTQMVFVTDCIWRSPLGLKINAVDTAGVSQTEDWVKVRGDQLVARDGVYDLSVTAELRETHFFDHIGLMAVDHPEDTEIFVDERFSPTAPPRLEVIATRTPRAFAAVRGHRGQDVGDVVAQRDRRYVDDFARTRYQGIAEDHAIEVELPADAPRGRTLYLIGAGWLHPTDTSVNVALSQNRKMPPPSGLTLEVPDGRGGWKAARRGLGFPAGKLKTVVLRVDDLFAPGAPRRVRLRTNLEIFWDQLQWAEAAPGGVRTARLPLREATLRHRGFSDVRAADASSPELPQSYAQLAGGAPRWRDLEGYYTRFGDVLPLLRGTDDRYVIMNAGDEMRLRFPARPAPASGWTRDFVFVGDGWVKDGNVNTTFGKTVLPLPAHDIVDYKTPPTTLENDPVYRRHASDWQTYHTRYVTPHAFAAALRPTP